jgi:hypothetical protein
MSTYEPCVHLPVRACRHGGKRDFRWAPILCPHSSRDDLLHPQIISIWCGFILGVCLMYGALLVKERGSDSDRSVK